MVRLKTYGLLLLVVVNICDGRDGDKCYNYINQNKESVNQVMRFCSMFVLDSNRPIRLTDCIYTKWSFHF